MAKRSRKQSLQHPVQRVHACKTATAMTVNCRLKRDYRLTTNIREPQDRFLFSWNRYFFWKKFITFNSHKILPATPQEIRMIMENWNNGVEIARTHLSSTDFAFSAPLYNHDFFFLSLFIHSFDHLFQTKPNGKTRTLFLNSSMLDRHIVILLATFSMGQAFV